MENKIICKICGYSNWNSLRPHILSCHQMTIKKYLLNYPGAIIYSKNMQEKNKNHSEGIRRSWQDPIKRKNRVIALQKAHASSEGRKNHSEGALKKFENMTPDQRILFRQKLKDTWAKPGLREKILKLSKIGLEKANSPESRQKMRDTVKTPASKEKHRRAQFLVNQDPAVMSRKRIAARRPDVIAKKINKANTISSLNTRFEKALNQNNLFPKSEQLIDYYLVDFLFPNENLIVEVDGDFWHANPSIYPEPKYDMQKEKIIKDKREATFCKNHGWTLLRFWETDINRDISSCIQKVQEKLYELQS